MEIKRKSDQSDMTSENDEGPGPKLPLVMLKAPLGKLKQIATRSQSNSAASETSQSSASETHHPRFTVRNGPHAMDKNGEPPVRRHSGGRKSAKSESKATRKSESWRQINSTREKDEEFLKNGPPELTNLYKPLSMNMSQRRENQGLEHSGRYQFEELDFRRM
jgi:hypothetical protein